MATALDPGLKPIWPISVETYHAMMERGILDSGDPVELLEGVIVQKPLKKPPHRFSNHAARKSLENVVPPNWYVDDQAPITLKSSEPGPDAVVVRGASRDYLTHHPGPNDVGMVVEISDTSFERDRILKKQIYAEAAIPLYWLLDLKRHVLATYAEPRGSDYGKHDVYQPEQSVDLVLDGNTVGSIRVSDLLP